MSQWVVVIPQRSWTVCYGLFHSHDECCDWLRKNGWHPADAEIYPVKAPSEPTGPGEGTQP